MPMHPVFLRVRGRTCVVLGGDEPAAGKAETCHRHGGRVIIVTPDLPPRLGDAVAEGHVRHVPRAYRPGDLAGAFLCYASLHDPADVAAVQDEARRERVLLNVIDVPDACDFHAPAVLERGALQIAVGTSGRSPAAAAQVRERVAGVIGAEYGTLVDILGAVRDALAGRPERAGVLRALAQSELPALLRRGDFDGVDRLLASLTGDACSLVRLGIAPGAGG